MDSSVYDAMTRLAQEWNVRYPLIDWHGNKGNIGGDGAAAMRYTEARLATLAEEGLLKNADKNICDMQPNYSEDLEEPVLLPALFPNLLCNPTSGIGVAMACNWMPYNLRELIQKAIIPTLNNEEVDYSIIYPDFPTGGEIINPNNVKTINTTGKGSIVVDGKYKIEKRGKKTLIVFYEIPYGTKIEYEEQGKPKGIIPQLRKALEEEKITGVSDIRDESAKEIRVVVELGSEEDVDRVIAQIYGSTDLRKSMSANYVALVGKTPKLLNLADSLDIYIQHNLNCIQREFKNEYEKTIARIHILEGLIWAVENIDKVIEYIRNDKDLCTLSDNIDTVQKKAILDMRLGRLSKLEREKLVQEKTEKEAYAAYCKKIVESENEQKQVLIERLKELDKKFGDARRTQIVEKEIVKTTASGKKAKIFIPEDVFVSMTTTGYLKSVLAKAYKQSAADRYIFKCRTDEMILLFSSLGKVYRLKVSEIKQCGSKDKGTAIGSILNLTAGEQILAIFSMNTDERKPYIVGFTKNGMVKKSEKMIYVGTTQNKNGLKAAGLAEDDKFIAWYESNGDYAVVLTAHDYLLKFEMNKVNPVGKTAKGVIAIKLEEGDYVTNAGIISPQLAKFKIKEYNLVNKEIPLQNRAGKGKKLGSSNG